MMSDDKLPLFGDILLSIGGFEDLKKRYDRIKSEKIIPVETWRNEKKFSLRFPHLVVKMIHFRVSFAVCRSLSFSLKSRDKNCEN